MSNLEEKIESLTNPIIEKLGYELYDVIYEKEAQDYYLRIFIDKPEGIDLTDCEKVNDSISDILDEADYIKDPYFLEVSSPGIERLLRKEKHFQANLGKEVLIKLFRPIEKPEKMVEEKKKNNSKKENCKTKELEGILNAYDEKSIELKIENTQKPLQIDRKIIATIRIKYNWN